MEEVTRVFLEIEYRNIWYDVPYTNIDIVCQEGELTKDDEVSSGQAVVPSSLKTKIHDEIKRNFNSKFNT